MNRISLLVALARDAWEKRKQSKKVGKLGLWQPGEIRDVGDEYVAYITVNGTPNAVLVRSSSKKVAVTRRALIIEAMMRDSRQEAAEAVQLIARTQGEQTIEIRE